jgi:hypothetical protein
MPALVAGISLRGYGEAVLFSSLSVGGGRERNEQVRELNNRW